MAFLRAIAPLVHALLCSLWALTCARCHIANPLPRLAYVVVAAVELPGLRSLELTRLGARMLPLSLTRLAGLTRLTFSGEMVRNLPLSDELRQLSNLQVSGF